MSSSRPKFPEFADHEGYIGAFTRHHAEGAIRNGATIRKVKGEARDATPLGTAGIVHGSMDGEMIDPEIVKATGTRFMYFIEWATMPRVVVAVSDWKISEDQ